MTFWKGFIVALICNISHVTSIGLGRTYSNDVDAFKDLWRGNRKNFVKFEREDGIFDSNIYRGLFAAIVSHSDAPFALNFVLHAFLPPNSPEYNLMVEEFAKLNEKLDVMDGKLDDLLKRLSFSQKSFYIKAVSDVNAGHKKLLQFVKEINSVSCIPNKTCLQVRSNVAENYVDYFDVYKQTHQVVEGALEGYRGFSEPLLDIVQKATDCNIDQLQIVAKAVASIIYKGGQMEIIRQTLKGSNEAVLSLAKQFKNDLSRLQLKHFKLRSECFRYEKVFDRDVHQIKIDVMEKISTKNFHKIRPALDAILKRKFDWITPFHFQFPLPYYRLTSYKWLYIYETDRLLYHYDKSVKASTEAHDRSPITIRNELLVYTNFQPKTSDKLTYSKRYPIEKILRESLTKGDKMGEYIQENLKKAKLVQFMKMLVVTAYPYLVDIKTKDRESFEHDNERDSYFNIKHGKKLHDKWQIYGVMFSDEEMVNRCSTDCQKGLCINLPRTYEVECHCPLDYQGRRCDQKSQDNLREAFSNLLSQALKLPSVSDIFYTMKKKNNQLQALIVTESQKGIKIYQRSIANVTANIEQVVASIGEQTVELKENMKSQIGNVSLLIKNVHQKLVDNIGDLQTFILARFNHVDLSISELSTSMQSSFLKLNTQMENLKEWTTLVSTYSQTFQLLQYYNYRFKKLDKMADGPLKAVESKRLATALLHPEGIRKWLFDLHYLFIGRPGIIFEHKGLLVSIIKERADKACTSSYKRDIDNAWKQMRNQQIQFFMLWVRAANILEKETIDIGELMKRRLHQQEREINRKLCSLVVDNSLNMCDGLYLLLDQEITVHCKDGFYPSRHPKTTCRADNQVQCKPCNCNFKNAISHNCDFNGKCSCKSAFFDDKCNSRNCVVDQWSSWGECKDESQVSCFSYTFRSMNTGRRIRTRSIEIQKQGTGKCDDKLEEQESCEFTSCSKCNENELKCKLDDAYVCADTKYNRYQRIFCTGFNQCEKNYDEHGCNKFKCKERSFNRGWKGFDQMNCIHDLIGSFLITGRKFRYQCCELDSSFKDLIVKDQTSHTDSGSGVADCGDGYMSDLKFEWKSGGSSVIKFKCYARNKDVSFYQFKNSKQKKRFYIGINRGIEMFNSHRGMDIVCPFQSFVSKFAWKVNGAWLDYSVTCTKFIYIHRGGRFG